MGAFSPREILKGFGSTILIGALTLGSGACSGDDSSLPPATTTPTTSSTSALADGSTTSTAPPTASLSEGDKYVALGSSIASGFGIPVQSTDCGRSDRNYPALIAAEYGLALTDVSCGAAVIPNIVDTAQGDHPPQIEAVTPDTKLITVTVGGNDIGYNATALTCGDPQTVCAAPASLEADLETARTALQAMIAQLEAAAPSATIVFVTYPREFPEGNCPELSLTDEEAALLRDMGERLEATFVDVVSESDVVFVDPYVVPGDHTGCAAASERWTAGRDAPEGFPYHPTALGHEAMAEMISTALGG